MTSRTSPACVHFGRFGEDLIPYIADITGVQLLDQDKEFKSSDDKENNGIHVDSNRNYTICRTQPLA